MYKKHKEIEIPKDDPFQNDKLAREGVADNLTKIIQSGEPSMVLSINAGWGFGKTTFIKMWMQKLKNENHHCIYYNAWENDFSENPFISFMGELEGFIHDPTNKADKISIKSLWAKTKKGSGSLMRKAIPLSIKFATQGLIDTEKINPDDIANLLSNFADNKIKEYQEEKKSIGSFKKSLSQFLDKLIAENEETKEPLVIFVDELDRCRPSYAVELLENIKHLFSVPGIVFVLGIDREQLAHTVGSIYGTNMDSDGYLRRFIDLEFNLPDPAPDAFFDFLWSEFNLDEWFKERQNQNKEAPEFKSTFCALSKAFNFSLRTQAQCFSRLRIILYSSYYGITIYPSLLIFLLFLKNNQPNEYQEFCENKLDLKNIESLIIKVEQLITDEEFFENYYWEKIKTFLKCSEMTTDEIDKEIENLKKQIPQQEQHMNFWNPVSVSMRLFNDNKYSENIKGKLINNIELSEKFKV